MNRTQWLGLMLLITLSVSLAMILFQQNHPEFGPFGDQYPEGWTVFQIEEDLKGEDSRLEAVIIVVAKIARTAIREFFLSWESWAFAAWIIAVFGGAEFLRALSGLIARVSVLAHQVRALTPEVAPAGAPATAAPVEKIQPPKPEQKPEPDDVSEIASKRVKVKVNHSTGGLSAVVVAGPFSGKTLTELSAGQLQQLLVEADNDIRTKHLIEAWLDRAHPGWRSKGIKPKDAQRAMDIKRAAALLGVKDCATADEINAAFRRISKIVHPDGGGSDELFNTVRLARDILLAALAGKKAA